MKKLMIGAAVAALCCSAVVGYCDATSGNIVGYAGYKITKGVHKIELTFKDVGSSENITVASLLPYAVEGDHIFCPPSIHFLAKTVDGKLHWTSQGKIVDDTRFPENKVVFRYLRTQKKETTLTIAGEVAGKWIEEEAAPNVPATTAPKK